jgi:MFS family permease
LIPIYAISLFTPTIINELGYSAANAQLLSVPPFVAGCVCTIIIGIYSDRCQLRGPFIIGGATVSLIGYIVLYTQTSPGVGYAGTFLAAMGVYPTIAVDIAWAGGNAGGDMKRGIVLALVVGLGNLGGCVISSFTLIRIDRLSQFAVYAPRSYISTLRISMSDTELLWVC